MINLFDYVRISSNAPTFRGAIGEIVRIDLDCNYPYVVKIKIFPDSSAYQEVTFHESEIIKLSEAEIVQCILER